MDDQIQNYLSEKQVIHVHSWDEFQDIIRGSQYRRWAFRGQERTEWALNSTLGRYFLDYRIDQSMWSRQEERIVRIFRRKAALFLDHIPSDDDYFEWLAIMQHYGAPTRLLDFSWSPYVAAFFALEKAKCEKSAVWAVNFSALRHKEYNFRVDQREETLRDIRPTNIDSFLFFFAKNRVPFLTVGEPYNMNQRQIAQSGTFVIPGILNKPIEGIIKDFPEPDKVIVKFELDTRKVRDEAMENLYYMNITNATLFPELSGLARSLAYELEFDWATNPKTLEKYI